MMLSEEAGGTPSSDLLVERAAAFDVLSIWNPDLDAGDGDHIRREASIGSTTHVGLQNYTGNWLLGLVTGNQNPRDASLSEMSIPGVHVTSYQSQ